MEFFVADQFFQHSLIRFRDTAGNQPIQHLCHFCFCKCSTVQKDLAESQYFTVRKFHLAYLLQTITFAAPVINHIVYASYSLTVQFEVITDVINVSLDTAFIHAIICRFLRFFHNTAIQKPGVNSQDPFDFIIFFFCHTFLHNAHSL